MSKIHDRDAQRKRIEDKINQPAARIAWWAVGKYKNEFLREVLKDNISESELLNNIVHEHYKRKNQ